MKENVTHKNPQRAKKAREKISRAIIEQAYCD